MLFGRRKPTPLPEASRMGFRSRLVLEKLGFDLRQRYDALLDRELPEGLRELASRLCRPGKRADTARPSMGASATVERGDCAAIGLRPPPRCVKDIWRVSAKPRKRRSLQTNSRKRPCARTESGSEPNSRRSLNRLAVAVALYPTCRAGFNILCVTSSRRRLTRPLSIPLPTVILAESGYGVPRPRPRSVVPQR